MLSKETHYSQRQKWLLILLLFNIAASIFHYTDNLLNFDAYPEPDWFSPYLTDSIWFFMTPLGIAGFWYYRQQKFQLAYMSLYGYFLLAQVTLGHYIISPIWEISLKMNTLILVEALMAVPLLFFVLWSQLILKENQQTTLGEPDT